MWTASEYLWFLLTQSAQLQFYIHFYYICSYSSIRRHLYWFNNVLIIVTLCFKLFQVLFWNYHVVYWKQIHNIFINMYGLSFPYNDVITKVAIYACRHWNTGYDYGFLRLIWKQLLPWTWCWVISLFYQKCNQDLRNNPVWYRKALYLCTANLSSIFSTFKSHDFCPLVSLFLSHSPYL